MIPEIIHYCWFGKSEIPKRLQCCIDSWKIIMPECRIVRWDETNFDVDSTAWTKEAYAAKKYAFVSDYVRVMVLEKYGGIYLDTDVMLKKSLAPLMQKCAFMGFENAEYLSSAILGFEPHFPVLREFLEYYKGRHFFDGEGNANEEANVIMMTKVLQKRGLVLNDEEQCVGDVQVFPREYFCPMDFYYDYVVSDNTFAIHYYDGSWLDEATKKRVKKERAAWYKKYLRVRAAVSKIYHRIFG